MRLYHYSTWSGKRINSERVILPSNRYLEFTQNTVFTQWPNLTFLTTDPYWDQSIQAYSEERFWEKCGSWPETYHELGIPCWKFEVNPNGLVIGDPLEFFDDEGKWVSMLEDAVAMGSDIGKWRIVVQDAYIINTWKWEDDEWNKI